MASERRLKPADRSPQRRPLPSPPSRGFSAIFFVALLSLIQNGKWVASSGDTALFAAVCHSLCLLLNNIFFFFFLFQLDSFRGSITCGIGDRVVVLYYGCDLNLYILNVLCRHRLWGPWPVTTWICRFWTFYVGKGHGPHSNCIRHLSLDCNFLTQQ